MSKARRIEALIISLIMVCSLCLVFASCSKDDVIKDLQQQIEDLKT